MNRINTFYGIHSKLAELNDSGIRDLFNDSQTTQGWGVNHTIRIGKDKVFVKRIPLTEAEYKKPFSTRNHFKLPDFYNYGVGSAGFGAWRELVTHIKTTNWVLNNENPHFPLMYHFRILKRKTAKQKIDLQQHKKYVAYWNNSKAVHQYIRARKSAKYEIVLFLEYFPSILNDLFIKDPSHAGRMFNDILKTTKFMSKQGLIHFDLHLHNILTDGKSFYVTDFGLARDLSFELSKSEKTFHNKHKKYDHDEMICGLGHIMLSYLGKLPKRKLKQLMKEMNFPEGADNYQSLLTIYKNLDKLNFMNKDFLLLFKKHKKTVLAMTRFYLDLRADSKKRKKYAV